MKTIEIEIAVAKWLNYRQNIIVISLKQYTHIALAGKHSKEIQELVTKIKELEK